MIKFKKVLSTILSLSVIMSVCSLPANAWAPTAFRNPKCMDLSELGYGSDYISLPENGKKNVCGCKKCTVDAITY